MKYSEIIADNLSKAGWSWGCVSALDSQGRTICIADAHRDDGKRYVVRADNTATHIAGIAGQTVGNGGTTCYVDNAAQKETRPACQRKDFETAIAQQQKEIESLTAMVKEQAAQIQKVSAQLELNKPAPQTVLNDQ